MKHYLYIINTFAIMALMCSCGKMDDIYQEFIEDSEEVLLSKLEGVEAYSGAGRVKFVIPAQTDPRVSKAQFHWDNDTNSKDIDLDITRANEFFFDDISEGSHIFYINAADDKGHKSLKTSITVSSFGEMFLSGASPSEVVSVARNSEGLCYFQISHSPSPYYQYMDIFYTDLSGEEKTIRIDRSSKSLFIDDLSGDSYSYQSVFLPSENSFESVTSKKVTSNDILAPQIKVDDDALLTFARGYTVQLPCLCTWETSCSVDDAAKSWLSATLTAKTLTVMALTRNSQASPRIGTITLTSDTASATVTVTQAGSSPKLGTAYGTEGIVFWQNPDKPNEYKILSAAQKLMFWSRRYSFTKAVSYSGYSLINGAEVRNIDLIRNMPDYGGDNEYAMEWVESIGEGFYMPSLNELKDELWPCFNGTVYEASTKSSYNNATADEKACRDKFEKAMADIGGGKVNMGTAGGTGLSMMSCTEKDEKTQVGFRMSNSLITTADKTEVVFYARGVKVVTIDD